MTNDECQLEREGGFNVWKPDSRTNLTKNKSRESEFAKRLTRAKQKIRDEKVSYEIPME